MKCTNCGNISTSETAKFCPYCGTKIQLLAEPQAASGGAQQAAPKHFAQAAPTEKSQPEPARQRVVIDDVSAKVQDSAYHTSAQAQVAASHVSKAEDLCAAARSELAEAKSVFIRMTGWGIAVVLIMSMWIASAGGSTGPAAAFLLAPVFFSVGPGMVGIRRWASRHGWFIFFNWVFIIVMLGVLLAVAAISGWFFYVSQLSRVMKAKHEVEEADQLLDRMVAEVY